MADRYIVRPLLLLFILHYLWEPIRIAIESAVR